MLREAAFPPGFQVFTKELKERETLSKQQPTCTLGKAGYLTFNKLATAILLGAEKKNEAVFIAYNAKTKRIALRPVPYSLGPPTTYSIVTGGGMWKGGCNIRFKAQAEAWRIPLDRTRTYPCRWDEENKVLFVEMSTEIRSRRGNAGFART